MRRKRAGGDGFQPLNTKEEIDVFDVDFNDDELWFFEKNLKFYFCILDIFFKKKETKTKNLNNLFVRWSDRQSHLPQYEL